MAYRRREPEVRQRYGLSRDDSGVGLRHRALFLPRQSLATGRAMALRRVDGSDFGGQHHRYSLLSMDPATHDGRDILLCLAEFRRRVGHVGWPVSSRFLALFLAFLLVGVAAGMAVVSTSLASSRREEPVVASLFGRRGDGCLACLWPSRRPPPSVATPLNPRCHALCLPFQYSPCGQQPVQHLPNAGASKRTATGRLFFRPARIGVGLHANPLSVGRRRQQRHTQRGADHP